MLNSLCHLSRFLPFLALLLMLLPLPASASGEPLEPAQAFRFSARAVDGRTIEARWEIADGYYMYRDKFRFELSPAMARLGTPSFPAGKMKDDENFGRTEVYRDEVRIRLPLADAAGLTAMTLKVQSQGCADMGICYPPLPQEANITLPASVKASGTNATPLQTPPSPAATQPASTESAAQAEGSETSQIAKRLKDGDLWTTLLFFLGSGLALAFTPCMFPMVPILSGIIVGHGHDISKGRAFVLSTAYVLGMAATYAAFGVAAGLSGTLLSAALQNVWFLGTGALIFVALALSMFGLYELQMPSFLQSRFSDEANRQQGGNLHGVVLMGAISAAIVGPCVAAPLAGALLHIARTGDALLGGSALFVMGLGMGLPLIVAGTSARHLLPRPGPWMNAVNRFFGVMLLGVAIWLVSPVIPAVAQMLAWSALLIFPAIYLHALDPLPAHAHGWQRFGKGIGVLALLAGTALLLGALGGSRDPLQPLSFLRGANAGNAPQAHEVRFERVRSLAELDARLKNPGKPVMLDFYADWCVSCKEMERLTFADPAVAARMNKMLLLQADVTADTTDDKALLKRFNLFGPPGIVFFDAAGRELPETHVVGFMPPETFLDVLRKLP